MRKIEPKSYKDRSLGMKSYDEIKRYPTFGLELDYLPEAKQWEIGKKYRVTLEIEMTGLRMGSQKTLSADDRADFDIQGIEVIGPSAKNKATRYDTQESD